MQNVWKKLAVSVCVVFGVAGCATSFTGNAHVQGPGECVAKCDAGRMDFAGMVYMGEYTSGCICRARYVSAPGTPTAQLPSADDDTFAVAAAPAAVGVVMQMRRAIDPRHY